ncbi:MAG: hypothetical protein IJ841_09430 [Prevotella sp.]|nr:hypothetical protein [Prevotella sp.]
MNKTIKLFLLAALTVAAGAMTTTSCTDYQDEVDALDNRVTTLENLVNRVNTNLASLRTIVDAMDQGDYITNVTKTATGTIITFAKHGAITILDGEKGDDAALPNIAVVQDPTDGNYYWTLNGEPLMVNGQKVQANGKDGEDGNTPQVKIEGGMWYYSLDGGKTWIPTGQKVTGEDGKDAPGVVIGATESSDGQYVIITINSGGEEETIEIPKKESMPVYVENIRLNFTSSVINVKKGTRQRIYYTIYPENASYKDVFFYTSQWFAVSTSQTGGVAYEKDENGDWYIVGNEVCQVTMRIVARFAKDDSVWDEVLINVIDAN